MHVVFGHVDIAVKHAQPAGCMDAVAGFLHHLAVKRAQRGLACVDATAGQLQLWPRLFLKGGKDAVARIDHGINAGARGVAAARLGPVAKTSVHRSLMLFSALCQMGRFGEIPPLAKSGALGYGKAMTDDQKNAIRETAARVLKTEGAAVSAMADALPTDFADAVRAILATKGRVILCGIGKSGHIARKISSTFASTGTPSAFVHPAEASHGDLGMVMPGDLTILISNSGETAELRDMVAHVARFAIPMVAISGRSDSTLMRAADYRLLLPPAPEACVIGMAPTTSTTLTLALGDALAVAVMEQRGFLPENFRTFHPGGKLGAQLSKVAQLMHLGDALPLVAADRPMTDTLIVMSEKSFGIAGVVEDGRLVGVISDGDLRRNIDHLMTRSAGQVATRNPRVIGADDLAAEAMAVMSANRITALFVVDATGAPVGLLHLHYCLRAGLA